MISARWLAVFRPEHPALRSEQSSPTRDRTFGERWRCAVWLAALSVAWFSGPTLIAQPADRVNPSEEVDLSLRLTVPKAKAAAFFQAWTRAHVDLENGRAAEARRGFATVLALLDELEATPSQRERVILAKAQLHAQVLGDRVAARQELARVLALNPNSLEAAALENRLKSEERKPQTVPDATAPPIELVPRLKQRKGDTP